MIWVFPCGQAAPHVAGLVPSGIVVYSLCPTTIVVLAQYLSDQVHKEVHVSSHIDVQVQTCNDAPGSELRRQRQRDGGSIHQLKAIEHLYEV